MGPKEWIAWVEDTWTSLYGDRPPWGRGQYVNLTKAWKQLGEDEDRAKATWEAFVASDHPAWEGHDPNRFYRNLSRFAARAARRRKSTRTEPETFRLIREAIVRHTRAGKTMDEARKLARQEVFGHGNRDAG